MASKNTKSVKLNDYQSIRFGKGKIVDIPYSDLDGVVPEAAMLDHFYNSGLVKEPHKDYDKNATNVLPIKLTPRQAVVWWNNPVRNDIEYIDAPGAPLFNIDGIKNTRSKNVHRRVGVIAPPSKEQEIRKLFDEAYPIEEQEKMVKNGRIHITIRPLKGALGRYAPSDQEIELDYRLGRNNSTLVHEGAHHLRIVDDERRHKVTKSPIMDHPFTNDIRNVEESCTVAEEMARGINAESGYYEEVMIYDNATSKWRKPTRAEAKKMEAEDRELFTHGTGKPLSGKAAIESVNKNWHKSHISRLKIKGSKTMAIKGMEKIEPSVKQNGAYQKTLMDAKRKAAKTATKKPAAKKSTAKKSTAKTVKAKKGLLSRKKSAAKRATTKKATTKKPVKASCNSVALSSIRSKKQKSKMSTKKATTKKPAAKTATKKPAASGRYAARRPSRAR